MATNRDGNRSHNWKHNEERYDDGKKREQNYLSVALIVLFILLLGVASVYS